MNWNYIDPGYGAQSSSSWDDTGSGQIAPTLQRITGQEELPENALWRYAQEQSKGEPGLEDQTLDLMSMVDPIRAGAKTPMGFAKNAWNRYQMGKEIPQFAEAMKSLGNPVSNTLKKLAGTFGQESASGMEPAFMSAAAETGEFANYPSKIGKLINELKGSWGVEVPYNAKGTQYPWAVVADVDVLPGVRKGLGGGDNAAKGWSMVASDADKYLGDVIGVAKQYLKAGTPAHEVGHTATRRTMGYPWLSENLPEEHIKRAQTVIGAGDTKYAPRALRQGLEDMATENPKYVDTLKDIGYGSHPLLLGDELMAREVAGQVPRLREAANNAPFVDPNPWLSRRMGSLVDEMTHPYFKNGMPAFRPAGSTTELPGTLYDYLKGLEYGNMESR